ncbi:MAG: toll/interleukin-1 receptor domain-containing protein [bacterium]|nr:toll/interleukin-1 receptor domain-containing protein [bacterium]
MKVFITWSGETSKAIAEILRGWLPSVIQAVKPYFSPDDITKGTRWSTEIAKELEECKIGLLCLTADNLEAPWIMFEAGALSKSLSTARVCPLLFGIEPSDIKGPLVQFQAASFAKDEMKKTICMINKEIGPTALGNDVLDSVFDMWWPKLETMVKQVLSTVQSPGKKNVRSERDILEEILARVRSTPQSAPNERFDILAFKDLAIGVKRLFFELDRLPIEIREELLDGIDMPLNYIISRLGLEKDLLRSNSSIERRIIRELKEREGNSAEALGEDISKRKPTPHATTLITKKGHNEH